MAANGIPEELLKNNENLKELVTEAKEFALQHGFLVRMKEMPNSSEVVTHASFTLFPSPVPKAVFLQALAVQTHFNVLVDKISQDPGFLEEALSSTIQADDFTARLFGIYRQVQKEGESQSIVLGLNRSDYMLDQREDGTSSLKQVEINTIAAGSCGVAACLPEVHRHILRLAGLMEESQCVPNSNPAAGMARGLVKAWELYGLQKAVVMFLVEDFQRSILDHRCIENELWKRNIPVIRRKFQDVSKTGCLNGDKKLFVGGLEVAVVYYRYGYMPDNYTEQSWEARLLMERSLAVKCPDISTHLAGTKKVQQELARPGVLERFFPDQPQVVDKIRATFTGLYTLDMGAEGDQTVAMALAKPDQFVLKPQREGGGNNFFGQDIVRVLEEVKGDIRRASYILMDRFQPKIVHNYLLRRGLPLKLSSCVYEIGVFGAYVRNGGEMVLNEVAGHVLRTKSVEHNDGGICNGVAVQDSPLIY